MKECFWVTSNIASGDYEQVGFLLANEAMMKKIITNCQHSCLDVRKEALWTLGNLITGLNEEQLSALV